MIIFNIYAIVVALIVGVCSLPVWALYHFKVIGEDLAAIFVSWIALVVSFILKQSGINGRLFFIPVWIICIPIPFYITYQTYGWTGILVTAGIFAALVGGVYYLLYSSERKKEQEIDYAEIAFPNSSDKPIEYWTKMKDLFFIPSMIKFTPAICKYNLKIVERLEADNVDLKTLADFKNEMIAGKNSFEPSVKVNDVVPTNLMTEIDTIITHLNELEEGKRPEARIGVN